MGRYLIKCDRELDLYVEWSTVVDNATWVGTRAQALLLPETDEDRLARTDLAGSSAQWGRPVEGAWEDPSVHVSNTDRRDENVYSYRLDRRDLAAYARALADDDTARAEALLVPNRHCTVCDTDTGIDPATNLCPAHQR